MMGTEMMAKHEHDLEETLHTYRWMIVYIMVVLTLGLILEILEAGQ